ncbi:MAG: type II secretion system protein GspJ [Gammaproteobacteria bacterium]|nr:MAG: type II secretion system protein GspJ [Gammaproteobacteria bacterium]
MINRNHKQGFTLLEMLVAIVIFAVVSGIAYSALNQTIKIGNRVSEADRRLSELQFALTYFNQDWMQVSPRKIRNQYGDTENQVVLADNRISFTRSGWNNLLQHKRSELQRVQYELVDHKLVRRYWRSLDQGIGEEPLTTVILSAVDAFEIQFINAEEQAIDTWPDELSRGLGPPIALVLTVNLDDFGEIRRIMEVPEGVL